LKEHCRIENDAGGVMYFGNVCSARSLFSTIFFLLLLQDFKAIGNHQHDWVIFFYFLIFFEN